MNWIKRVDSRARLKARAQTMVDADLIANYVTLFDKVVYLTGPCTSDEADWFEAVAQELQVVRGIETWKLVEKRKDAAEMTGVLAAIAVSDYDCPINYDPKTCDCTSCKMAAVEL